MPHIFDNIEQALLPALRNTLEDAGRADFCVGYFHLRGWGALADLVERLEGTDESCCRLLVGMHRPPQEIMRSTQRAIQDEEMLDGPTVARLRREASLSFKEQIEFGVPSAAAEAALRRLARQLRQKKVCIRLFLRYALHAKLYLVKRSDPITPLIGYVGSSNLTFAGLAQQGELNVDVVEQDAARKLQKWFDERWQDKYAFDISDELATLIETSWASERPVKPYHVYLKMVFHLCQDARQGEREFHVPHIFADKGTPLLDFQERAVSLAAHHLHQRGGILLGDVVGLGKTLMATAIAKIFEEDEQGKTLIVCPPKLIPMWQYHIDRYELNARVLSLGKHTRGHPSLEVRYRLVIVDESHNLRNREGKRYRVLRDYIQENEPRVLLLSATPYNKQYIDLSNQLRLFIDEDQELHTRPEKFFELWQQQGHNEDDFIARFQTSPRSLRAFEQSLFPDDWRDLMRLFLVRRTRQFIMKNYAQYDKEKDRYFVTLKGEPSYFPLRDPKRLPFKIDESDPNDQYARLHSARVVQIIGDLRLPRYGLENYLVNKADKLANSEEKRILENLTRAGRRLIGFCRTNLFKRLESSGYCFLLSLERHILRNMVTLHTIAKGLPVPIGTQDAAMLDAGITDQDDDFFEEDEEKENDQEHEIEAKPGSYRFLSTPKAYQDRAAEVYASYRTQFCRRFHWLDPKFFTPQFQKDLQADADALLSVLTMAGDWKPPRDAKLEALHSLLTKKHKNEKIIVFTQFADTAGYLGDELRARGVHNIAAVTSDSSDPTALARRFSPNTNGGLKPGEPELRVLLATDVLAEGQNLQDGHIVVNFDLPWAIIRLIQRAGRVDRIGQRQDTIRIYSFLPSDGVEQIINLRARLRQRLEQNQEVIGSDESFFGEEAVNRLRDLYTEQAGCLDDEDDEDIDLASVALQIWNSATERDRNAAGELPPVVPASRSIDGDPDRKDDTPGVITYLRFPDGTDGLMRVDDEGNVISQSLTTTFRAAACAPDTPALPQALDHHELVAKAVQVVMHEQATLGGQLGSLRSTRRKVYERLRRHREVIHRERSLFTDEYVKRLDPAYNALFRSPLKERAREALGRQMRLGITDEQLAEMVIQMYEEERLCNVMEVQEQPQPQIICSLGLRRMNVDR